MCPEGPLLGVADLIYVLLLLLSSELQLTSCERGRTRFIARVYGRTRLRDGCARPAGPEHTKKGKCGHSTVMLMLCCSLSI